jgi:hypothetical protein
MIGFYTLILAVNFTLIQFSTDLNEEKNYDFYILNKNIRHRHFLLLLQRPHLLSTLKILIGFQIPSSIHLNNNV